MNGKVASGNVTLQCVIVFVSIFVFVFVFDFQLYLYSDLCPSEWKGCSRQRDIAKRDLDALCISISVATTAHLSYSSAHIFIDIYKIFVLFKH